MVNTLLLNRARQAAIFVLVLAVIGIALAVTARFRVGLLGLRLGVGLFTLGSVLYCLSLIGESLWAQSGRFSTVFAGANKELVDGERD
jgi:hypothetical protein